MKLLPQNKSNIMVSRDYKNTSTIQRCILWVGIPVFWDSMVFQRSTVARGTAYGKLSQELPGYMLCSYGNITSMIAIFWPTDLVKYKHFP